MKRLLEDFALGLERSKGLTRDVVGDVLVDPPAQNLHAPVDVGVQAVDLVVEFAEHLVERRRFFLEGLAHPPAPTYNSPPSAQTFSVHASSQPSTAPAIIFIRLSSMSIWWRMCASGVRGSTGEPHSWVP